MAVIRLRDRPLPLVVAGIALVAALLRVPFLGNPAALDEGGFYLVAQSWLHGGHGMYGTYWVDRPPGLIALFAIAAGTGHFVVIRLVALVATVVLVLAVARTAHVLGGSAVWAAIAAAALTVTPRFGANLAPGELLASAGVALTFLAAVEARRTTGRRALVLAVAAGVLGVAAASVKQDFVDGLVAVAVLFVADSLVRISGAETARRSRTLLLGWAGGVLIGGLILLLVSFLAMPGPGTLFNAVVTFRIDAQSVLASSPGGRLTQRLAKMDRIALISGLLPLLLVLGVAALRRFRSPTAPVLAVIAGAAVTIVGIVGGGGGWSHYLIGPAVWAALGAGLAGRWILTRAAVALAALSCLLAVAVSAHAGTPRHEDRARSVGLAIHHAAQPGDTAITLYGVANIQFYSGLPSPYPYLWSLPARVRDRSMAQLRALVAGADAPTWIVQTNGANFKGGHRAELGALVAQRYRVVSASCGSHLWLLDGQDRTVPRRFPCRSR